MKKIELWSALAASISALVLCVMQAWISMNVIVGDRSSTSVPFFDPSLIEEILLYSFMTVFIYMLPVGYCVFNTLKPVRRAAAVILSIVLVILLAIGYMAIYLMTEGRSYDMPVASAALFVYFLLPTVYAFLPAAKAKNRTVLILSVILFMAILTAGFTGVHFWFQTPRQDDTILQISALILFFILIPALSAAFIIPKLAGRKTAVLPAPVFAVFLTVGYAIFCAMINLEIFHRRIAGWSTYEFHEEVLDVYQLTPTVWMIPLSAAIFFFIIRIIQARLQFYRSEIR